MAHAYHVYVKEFCRREIFFTMNELGITNEKAAELLGIDIRSYYRIKSGEVAVSTSTLLIFLTVCKHPEKFLADFKKLLEQIENEDPNIVLSDLFSKEK